MNNNLPEQIDTTFNRQPNNFNNPVDGYYSLNNTQMSSEPFSLDRANNLFLNYIEPIPRPLPIHYDIPIIDFIQSKPFTTTTKSDEKTKTEIIIKQ